MPKKMSTQKNTGKLAISNVRKGELPPYRDSLAGSLLGARETVMAPIRPFLRDAGVTEQQWRVLRVLSDHGPLDLKTVASKALLHPPSVSRIIRELMDRQLIMRTVDDEDKRRSILSLTKTGLDLVQETSKHTVEILKNFADRFGDDRLAFLIAELQAFSGLLEDTRPEDES